VPHGDLRLRRLLLTDRIPEAPHQAETYARLARTAGAAVDGPPIWRSREGDPQVDVPTGHIGLNPVCQVGTRAWAGWAALAAALAEPVVFYAGPGEDPGQGRFPAQVGLTIAAFGSALRRCAVFVSSDTGPAHFARACGVPTVVIFGPTGASRTGPAGACAVEGPDPGCRPCYAATCPIDRRCMDVGIAPVLRAIAAADQRR
jgi:hypothetical protein